MGSELKPADEEGRGHDFAEAIYEAIAEHGPSNLAAAERNALGDRIVAAASAWVRGRNRAAMVQPPADVTEMSERDVALVETALGQDNATHLIRGGMVRVVAHDVARLLSAAYDDAWNRRSEPRGDSPLAPEGAPQLASGGNRDPEPSSAAPADIWAVRVELGRAKEKARELATRLRSLEAERAIAKLTRLPPQQWRVLGFFAERDPYCEFGWGFATIMADTGFGRAQVCRACRALRRLGFVRYERAMWSDDGEPMGAGYALTPAGAAWWERAAPAERTASPVAVDDRTQAASEASEPPTRDGADKPRGVA